MQKIGPCQFKQLPLEYQNLFETGTFESSKGFFLESKPPSSAIGLAIFFGLIYIIPSLILIISGVTSVFQKPKLISRIVEDLSSGLVIFIVGLLILIVILWGSILC